MQITFIIGNGFDVGAGYHTQYSDFYTNLLAGPPVIPSDKPHVAAIIDSIRQDQAHGRKFWSDLEWGLGQFTNEFSGGNYRRLLKKHASGNGPDGVNAFLDCAEYVTKELRTFLSDKTKTFDCSALNSTDLAAAERIFAKFHQESAVRAHLNPIIQAKINEDWKLNFISFNYTPVLKGYLSRLSALSKSSTLHPSGKKTLIFGPVIHAHGDLSDVIMGVGDYRQIASQSLRQNANLCNLIIKPAIVDNLRQNWYHDGVEAIFRSSIVCIYGASLGKTDIFWWTKIAKWLYLSKERHLIIYHYDQQATTGNVLSRSRNSEKPIESFQKFVHAWMLEEYPAIDAGTVRDLTKRIHVVTHDIKLKNP